jgi:hypothetical protein
MERPTTSGPDPRERLIPIIPDGRPLPNAKAKVDPYEFWLRYYRSNDARKTDPEALREMVRILNLSKKTRDAHAALRGFLINHPKDAESWMYRAMALAIEENQGSPSDVIKSLEYAAELAQKSHNPNDLVGAADALFLKGHFGKVGPLLDEAMDKVPHRAPPMIMSINLAAKTKDPVRMADSVERLMALGWPGQDDFFRVEARSQVEQLAGALKEEGHAVDAEKLLARLSASETRDLYFRLSWDGEADFDILVDEPLGATASYQTPRTVFGGSILRNGAGSHPEEVYVCPRAFDGDYVIRVSLIYIDEKKPPTRLTLETITHEGTSSEKKEVHRLDPAKPNKPIVVHLDQGRRKRVLPYVDPLANVLSAARAKMNAKPPASSRGGSEKGTTDPSRTKAQSNRAAVDLTRPDSPASNPRK